MRLRVNEDESATFRERLRTEIERGAEMITIGLRMDKDDAARLLANSSDGKPIECVWTGGFGPR